MRAVAGRLGFPDDLYRGLPDEYEKLLGFCEGVVDGLRKTGTTPAEYLATIDTARGVKPE